MVRRLVRSEQSKVQQPVQPRSNTGNRTLAARLAAAPDSPRDQNQTRGADQWEDSEQSWLTNERTVLGVNHGDVSCWCTAVVERLERLGSVQTRTTTNNLLLIGKLWLTRFQHPFTGGNQSCINLNSQQIQLSLSQTWLDESIIIRLLYSLSSVTSGRIGWQLITW